MTDPEENRDEQVMGQAEIRGMTMSQSRETETEIGKRERDERQRGEIHR